MIALTFLVALAAPAGPAAASTPAPPPSAEQLERARALFSAGSRAYRQGRYDVAIEAFEGARAVVQRAPVLFSLAQAYRLQYFVAGEDADLERAVALYRAYLDAAPEGGRRDHAVQHLATLTPLLARVEDAAEAGEATRRARLIVTSDVAEAVAALDGEEPRPTPATFDVEPGAHTVELSAPGYAPATRTVEALAGSTVAIDLEPDPLPGRLTVKAEPGARIAVDGRVVARAPLGAPLELSPGRHVLAVLVNGHEPSVHAVELARDQRAQVVADLEVTRQRMAAWSLVGVGAGLVVGAGVATGFAIDAENEARDLEDQQRAGGLTLTQVGRYRELRGDRDELRDLAIGLGVSGGVALLTGALLWAFDAPEAPRGPLFAH